MTKSSLKKSFMT